MTPYAAEAGVLSGVSFAGVGALRASDEKALWTADAGTVKLGSASTWALVTGGTVCTTAEIGGIPEPRGGEADRRAPRIARIALGCMEVEDLGAGKDASAALDRIRQPQVRIDLG